MDSFHTGDHTAGDHIHTSKTKCNTFLETTNEIPPWYGQLIGGGELKNLNYLHWTFIIFFHGTSNVKKYVIFCVQE